MYKVIRELGNGNTKTIVTNNLRAALNSWQAICKEYDFYIRMDGTELAKKIDDFGRACYVIAAAQWS